jgi:two-component system, chemotaxis family, protein-glutamate methylesterase/glutaminase
VKPVRVVVVDDSSFCRAVLREILERDGDIEVVGEAADGAEAREAVARLRPQLITVDIEMPGTDGLTAIGRIMADCPLPILVVTGRPAEARSHTLFEAVRRGALDLFPKPSLGEVAEARALRELVRRLSTVPVVRHLPTKSMRAAPVDVVWAATTSRVRVIGIGASAGGPAAVAAVLAGLPRETPACLLVVQHLLPGFARSFSEFLRHNCALSVQLVEREVTWRPGTVFVAPDERHLVALPNDRFAPVDTPPEGGHRPAVDVLFRSLAEVHGKSAAGVVLSGMGDDGTRGLTAMAGAGALTLAQSEEGCAVYGMPRAAMERGAARRAVPLVEMADVLDRAMRGKDSGS